MWSKGKTNTWAAKNAHKLYMVITKSISVIIVVYDVLWAGDDKFAILSLDLAGVYLHVLKM